MGASLIKARRIALLAGLFAVLGTATASAAPTIVSLTFDDGVADQWTARELLKNRGLHGTFYVNSSRPGKARFMSFDQLYQLAADGNEIGGHTIDHVDLPTLGPDDQKRQICDDRADLLARGFAVTDFAYPFGSHNAAVEEVVKACGYNTARITSGIVSPRGCNGCPAVESFPPPDLYATRTPDSVKGDTPLSDLTGYVDKAQAAGGGWLTIVIHHVCNTCNPDAITPADLGSLLDYLVAKAPEGVQVKTVQEVVGGALQPAVHGPVLPQIGAPINLLRNASLETDTYNDGEPDCWKQGGSGVSTATWLRTSDAFEGSAAQQLQITALGGVKADRKLVSRQDTGTCAPRPVAHHRYRFTWRAKSTATTWPVAYVRKPDGGWKFWVQGQPVKASPTAWRQSIFTTPHVPDGTTGISIGVSLRSAATMTVDDLLLQDTRTPLPAPAQEYKGDGEVPAASTAALKVATGRLPVVVYGALPENLLDAQQALQRHLATLRRAGFTPIGAKAFAHVLKGGSAGVKKPVVIAFRGSAVDTIGIADNLLRRDGARAILIAPPTSVLAPATLRRLARAPYWDVVAPGSPAGRAIRGGLSIRAHALRVGLSFATPNGTLVRALRTASKRPRRTS